jgi:hypothetical protein
MIRRMMRLGSLLAALLVCFCVAASAAAGPPLPSSVHFAVSHQRPVHGREFTGLTITSSDGIASATCDMTVGHRLLQGHQQEFFEDGVVGASAVACSWKIPANVKNKLLHGSASVTTVSGEGVDSPILSWHIK